ncbi:MAG: hypothetical protein KFF73_14120 [Cyclobacteriaceae bacterium]|nr:hypothetical protein [Cyclobacteriaceae bacterium]
MFDKIKTHFLLILLLLLASGLFLLYLKIQPRLDHDFSALFDANKYLDVYMYFSGENQAYEVVFPINSRILVPWIASLMPFEEPVNNFLLVNYFFMILSVIAIYYLWISMGLSKGFIMTGFFWLLIHWTGIIRLNIFDPVTVDLPLYLFQALLILIIIKKQFHWLLILAPLATLQKESFMGLMVISFITGLYLYIKKNGMSRSSLLIVFLALVLSFVAREITNYYFPPADEGRNSMMVLLFHARESILNPFRLVRWLIGIFTAYGPLLILAVWYKIIHKNITSGNEFLIMLSLTYLGFSLLGGGDFARLAFLGFPFIMSWILISLENVRGFLFRIAFIMGLPLMKLFRNIPDPAVTGWERFNNFYPEFANPVIVLLWLGYGVLCVLAFRIIHKKLSLLP